MKSLNAIGLFVLLTALTNCSRPDEVFPALSCKNILVDASHDGGSWWYPQSTDFKANNPHQGQAFAQMLRGQGYSVDELPRGQKITDEILKKYKVILRASGFTLYERDELAAYQKAIDRGITLLLLTDHKKFNPTDGLAEMLGVEFKGGVGGTVSTFSNNPIVRNVMSLDYMYGSVITNCDSNKKIEPIGWLSEYDHVDYNFNGIEDANEPGGMPVMGILHHNHSRILLMGDINAIEVVPQPFSLNLVNWISKCDSIQ